METAENVAAQAFAFLAAEPARLVPFLEASGLDPADLRARAGTREFLAAVLDHLVRDEPLLLIFAAEAGLKPEQAVMAGHVLSGDVSS